MPNSCLFSSGAWDPPFAQEVLSFLEGHPDLHPRSLIAAAATYAPAGPLPATLADDLGRSVTRAAFFRKNRTP